MKPLIFLYLTFIPCLYAQRIESVNAYFDDEYSWWQFYEANEHIGDLQARWAFDHNYRDWNIRIGEMSGEIRQRWMEKPHYWELRWGNELAVFYPVWPNQLDTWRIEFRQSIYTYEWQLDPDGVLWQLHQSGKSLLHVYNEYFGDLRDWLVEYEDLETDVALQIISVFITTYYAAER